MHTVFVALPVTLYGPQALFADLSQEHGLKVFENKALRRKFGRNRIWKS
jgi:hypothetical protein